MTLKYNNGSDAANIHVKSKVDQSVIIKLTYKLP